MPKQKLPVYNTAGTHIFTLSPTGDEWECPVDYWPTAEKIGFTLTEPRDKSLDGLFDDSTAEGANQTGFDPAKATVEEINTYLAENVGSPGEVVRVLELEAAGKNRQGVKDPRLAETPGD